MNPFIQILAGWAILALLMPLIILGGIYGGVFTPTEAAVVAVFYGLIVGLFIYREIKVKDLKDILASSAITTSVIMIIIANASLFGWIMTRERVPQMFSTVGGFASRYSHIRTAATTRCAFV